MSRKSPKSPKSSQLNTFLGTSVKSPSNINECGNKFTSKIDINKFMPPQEPLPKVGEIYRYGDDANIQDKFYLISEIRVPQKMALNQMLIPSERHFELEFTIYCQTFIWNSTEYVWFDELFMCESWFRKPIRLDTPKFIKVGHACEMTKDPNFAFLTEKWLKADTEEGWIFEKP